MEAATQRALIAQVMTNTWLAEHGAPFQLDVLSGLSLDRVAAQLGASNPMAVVGGAANVVGNVGLMLLLSVFFLLGGPQLADQVIQTFGTRAAPDVRYVLTAAHDAVEGFVWTQLLQAVMYAGGVWACWRSPISTPRRWWVSSLALCWSSQYLERRSPSLCRL